MADNILGVQAASEALKLFYLDTLRYQLNTGATPLLAQLERDSQSVEGSQIVMALRYGRSGGIGSGSDIGDLPTPNSRKTKQAKWETKNLYARIMISEKTIKAARSNKGAFANLLTQELDDILQDAKDNLSRQCFGDGNGILATISAVAGNVLTLTAGSVDYFAEGMMIDIHNGSNNTKRNSDPVEVTVVDEDNNKITINSVPTGTAANDFICVQNSYNQELTGLKAVFEASSLYGIDRSTNKWLNAKRINVNGEISEVKIQEAIDWAFKKAGANINFLVCSDGVRRAYLYLLQSQKRQVNTLELKGGWTALEYAGGQKPIGLTFDRYAPSGTLDALDTEDWKMYDMGDWDWMDRDGAILSRVSGKPAYEAVLIRFADLGCQRPRGQVRLYQIQEH